MTNAHAPFLLLALVSCLFIAMGCSTSNTATTEKERANYDSQDTWTLKDHLRRASGVRIIGTKGNVRIIIRGESSVVNPNTQPLFVIDGQKAGRNFSDVNSMLREGEINYIQVLPPSKATQYGMEGNYGVIRIFTKNEDN